MSNSNLFVSLHFILQNNSVRYLPGFGPAVPQECSDCGKSYNMGGPIWSAPIHDQEWVTSILEDVKSMKDRYPAYERISAVLTTISEVCIYENLGKQNIRSEGLIDLSYFLLMIITLYIFYYYPFMMHLHLCPCCGNYIMYF